ncbi:tRNA dimethylallyltransferase [Candidatus Saccharibacteria bacterium]|nr:tRNA dimethylallyltransferase [Candidatus Saccharibacteria bacterium]
MIPVIVGPTGSGKTGVAIEIAKEIGGEVISADSRTIYKGMDIGTAKPTDEERDGILHYGFDLVEPNERFTVADWKAYAEEKIREIRKKGKVPMIVGGTGLYVDALVYDYKFETSGKGYDKNRGACTKNLNGRTGSLAQDDYEKYPDRQEMCAEYKIFGILWESEELRKRLRLRAEQMFSDELYEETKRLIDKYGWNNQAMKSNIYQFAWRLMQGEISRENAIRLFVIDDWHLAKRQMTWFRRNENILWLPLEKVKEIVIKCIQNEQRK